jgi:hypothetical protein
MATLNKRLILCIQHFYTPDVQIQVQNDGNLNFVFEHLIFEVAAVCRESHKTRKVLKIKDFYVSIRCIPITHSTCAVCGNMSTGWTSTVRKPPSSRMRRSRASVEGLHDT